MAGKFNMGNKQFGMDRWANLISDIYSFLRLKITVILIILRFVKLNSITIFNILKKQL